MLYVKPGEKFATAHLPDGGGYEVDHDALADWLTFPDGAFAKPEKVVALSRDGAWVVKEHKELFERAVTKPEEKVKKPKK